MYYLCSLPIDTQIYEIIFHAVQTMQFSKFSGDFFFAAGWHCPGDWSFVETTSSENDSTSSLIGEGWYAHAHK